MKKGDAAKLAENTLKDTHWLPSCFLDVKPIETPIDTTQNNTAPEVAQTQPQPIVELESKSVT
uniref:hypothetical protein n=1 Tax=Providencia stuartii TaxID=588 RepID=UPI0024B14069